MVARERHPVRRLQHLHWRVASEQIDHQALMRRIEMLDQDEGHAAVGRQGVKKLLEGVETTGRGPQSNDWEIHTRALGQRAPIRLLPRLAGLYRPATRHDFGFREPGFPSGNACGRMYPITHNCSHEPFSTTFRQPIIELGMFRTLAEAFPGVLMPPGCTRPVAAYSCSSPIGGLASPATQGFAEDRADCAAFGSRRLRRPVQQRSM